MRHQHGNITRRDFIGTASFAAAACAAGCATRGAAPGLRAAGDMRAVLLHLGHNMWKDSQTEMGLSEPHWDKAVRHMAACGLNTLVVDVGEGMRFESHPELAIRGSWAADKVRDFVRSANALGIEVVPKLNFSACHDAWLGEYHRMISTRKYYEVTADLIRETADAFCSPRYFHLGMDEEIFWHQRNYDIAIIRGAELWWHDLLHFVGCAEKAGCRAWIWSDFGWKHPDFVTRCPKSVLQSNWYYDDACTGFDVAKMSPKDPYRPMVAFFAELEKAGFDQVPCGSNWVSSQRREKKVDADGVIGDLVRHCRKTVAPERLKGFMMTSWNYITDDKSCAFACRGMDLLAEALKA